MPLVPLVRDLRSARPRSRIAVLGTAMLLEHATLVALVGLEVASYLLWEDLCPGMVARCLTLLVYDNLLVGSRRALVQLLARWERRHTARIDTLVLTEQERSALYARMVPPQGTQLRATVWEENPDLTALIQTVCALAGAAVTLVSSAEALLAAAMEAHTSDLLVVDCSLALPEDMARCVQMVMQSAVPIYIIHPRPHTVALLRSLARSEVYHVAPDEVGLALLERLRLVRAQVAPARHPALTVREVEVWRLVAQQYHDTQIADTLDISASTVKTMVTRIKEKLGLHHRTDLIAAYERLTTG